MKNKTKRTEEKKTEFLKLANMFRDVLKNEGIDVYNQDSIAGRLAISRQKAITQTQQDTLESMKKIIKDYENENGLCMDCLVAERMLDFIKNKKEEK